MDRKTVLVDQASARAGVSRRTIYYWMVAQKVEYMRAVNGSRRIFVDTLDKHVEAERQRKAERG